LLFGGTGGARRSPAAELPPTRWGTGGGGREPVLGDTGGDVAGEVIGDINGDVGADFSDLEASFAELGALRDTG
jgi:hypothetical protein